MDIEVFKAGLHTDSSGNTKEWKASDLDHIVASYNPQNHEAPVVIGHPKDNSPAYGWVHSIKREGDVLIASLKNINPEFADMVKSGAFKKRSIALHPDMTLRHVGFLGAMPPAVKGLKDATFKAAEGSQIEFSIFQAGNNTPPPDDNATGNQPNKSTDPAAELQTLKDQVSKLQAQIGALQQANKQGEFTDWCDKLVSVGKLTPAQKPLVAEFMHIMAAAGQYEFSEFGKRPAIDAFKEFIGTLPPQVHLKEIATKEFAAGDTPNPDAALGQKIADSLKPKNKGGK